MSSLGDLLLAHLKPNKSSESPPQEDESTVNKIFPDRVEKNEVEETQSNASSTDDYVRELLDPDDRPRNVWHVVEGPKVQPDDETSQQSRGDNSDEDSQAAHQQWQEGEEERVKSRTSDYQEEEGSAMDTEKTNRFREREDENATDIVEGTSLDGAESSGKKASEDHALERRHDDNDKRSGKIDDSRRRSSHRDRSRERSSRRHRHHDRDKDRNHVYDRDRDDRLRSRRKNDHSDDDSRRRSRTRDHRRSHSRSKISSRRRDRSRSESQSPVTKRNSRTVLIMQLNPRVHSRDLEEFFSDIGKVREVRLIMDSKTRRHKGIAYIEFEDASSAAKAFALNGQKFFGAPIVIQSAQLEKNRSSSDWHSSTSQTISHSTTSHQSSRSQLPPNSYRVYVGGLNVNLTEEMIRSVFEPFGPIIRLELMRDRVTNVSRGYAFITYAHIEDGQNAVQSLDGFELAGKNLRVSKSTDKSERYSGNTESNSGTGGGRHHNDGDTDGRSSRSRDLTASLYELAGH